MNRLIDHNGQLCIAVTYPGYSDPVLTTSIYPTGLRVADYVRSYGDEHIGATLTDGRFPGFYNAPYPSRLEFQLQDGGATLPIDNTREPIPSPKVRNGIATRWIDGRWEKCLKRGWVPA